MQKCESCGQMILEKGIPLPPKKKGKWNFLNDMRIGDSIICTTIKDFEDIRGAMRYRKMRYRSLKEPQGTGWRIWRIK